jgi:hypothetical protein
MISLIITILIDYKKNKHIGDKNPRVTRGYPQTRWVRVWAKFQTRHGYGFFNGCKYFSWVRVWDSKTRRVCTRCHLYMLVTSFQGFQTKPVTAQALFQCTQHHEEYLQAYVRRFLRLRAQMPTVPNKSSLRP